MYPKRCEYTPIMHQKRGINGVKRQKISGVVLLLLLHCLVRGVIGVRGVKTKGAGTYKYPTPFCIVRIYDACYSKRMTPTTMAMECIWSRRSVKGG